LPSDRVVWLATSNKNKLREAETIVAGFGIRVKLLPESKLEIQSSDLETISTFAANQISKRHRGMMVVVEDSGLFVSSLGGFPGPFSSYTLNTLGNEGILMLLGNSKMRKAFFQCSIALSKSGRTLNVFTGKVNGGIARKKQGEHGFGFDPIFMPEGTKKTFGEMSPDEKNTLSHRSLAFTKMATWLLAQDQGWVSFSEHSPKITR
jgi:XTP/dITP diphosphohydrolase